MHNLSIGPLFPLTLHSNHIKDLTTQLYQQTNINE